MAVTGRARPWWWSSPALRASWRLAVLGSPRNSSAARRWQRGAWGARSRLMKNGGFMWFHCQSYIPSKTPRVFCWLVDNPINTKRWKFDRFSWTWMEMWYESISINYSKYSDYNGELIGTVDVADSLWNSNGIMWFWWNLSESTMVIGMGTMGIRFDGVMESNYMNWSIN